MTTLEEHTNIHREALGIGETGYFETLNKLSIDWIFEKFTCPGLFVDVGCNYGYTLKYVKEMYGLEAVGLDLFPQNVYGDSVTIIQADLIKNVEALKMEKQVGCYFFNHTIEHFRDFITTLETATENLVEGGGIFIAVPAPGSEDYVRAGHFCVLPEEFIMFWLQKLGYKTTYTRNVDFKGGFPEFHVLAIK